MAPDGAVRRSSAACRTGGGVGLANCVLFCTNGDGAQAASVARTGATANSTMNGRPDRRDLTEITDAKRLRRTMPPRPTDISHSPNATKPPAHRGRTTAAIGRGEGHPRYCWGVMVLQHTRNPPKRARFL